MGRRTWLIGVALLAVLAGFGAVGRLGSRPTNLGVTTGQLAPCPPTPNCVSTQATDAAHRIEPISLTGSSDEARARLGRALRALSGVTVVADEPPYLHAEFKVPWVPFVDDVEFWLDEAAGLLHFRSASRLGQSDLGVNRARMERFRAAWAAAE